MKYSLRSLMIGFITFLAGCGGNQSPPTPKAQAPVQPATTTATKKVTAIKRGYDTPEKAFAAYTKAMQGKEWGTAFDTMTPAMQRFHVLELSFAAGMNDSKVVYRHVDQKEFLKERDALGPESTEEQSMALLLKLMPDRRAFFIDVATELGDDLQESIPKGPLKKVTITGKQAMGVAINSSEYREAMPGEEVMKTFREEYEQKFYFARGNDGWRMDAPPGAIGVVRDTEPGK